MIYARSQYVGKLHIDTQIPPRYNRDKSIIEHFAVPQQGEKYNLFRRKSFRLTKTNDFYAQLKEHESLGEVVKLPHTQVSTIKKVEDLIKNRKTEKGYIVGVIFCHFSPTRTA